jgi:hypothetical protein
MHSNPFIVTAAVAFSLLALPAHASTRQEAPLLEDAVRCVSLYLIASGLYGPETPEAQAAITLGNEWYSRAKEQNAQADSSLPENDPGTTEGMIAMDVILLAFTGGYDPEQSSLPDVIRTIRRDLEACEA